MVVPARISTVITAAFANEDIQANIVKQVGQIYIIPAINFKSGIFSQVCFTAIFPGCFQLIAIKVYVGS